MRSNVALLLVVLVCAPLTALDASPTDPAVRRYMNRYRVVAKGPTAVHIPSFSRQTGLACSVCHTSFPQLTEFGRTFKLGGYTMTAEKTVDEKDKSGTALRLNFIPQISAMVIASVSQTRSAPPSRRPRTGT